MRTTPDISLQQHENENHLFTVTHHRGHHMFPRGEHRAIGVTLHRSHGMAGGDGNGGEAELWLRRMYTEPPGSRGLEFPAVVLVGGRP